MCMLQKIVYASLTLKAAEAVTALIIRHEMAHCCYPSLKGNDFKNSGLQFLVDGVFYLVSLSKSNHQVSKLNNVVTFHHPIFSWTTKYTTTSFPKNFPKFSTSLDLSFNTDLPRWHVVSL